MGSSQEKSSAFKTSFKKEQIPTFESFININAAVLKSKSLQNFGRCYDHLGHFHAS